MNISATDMAPTQLVGAIYTRADGVFTPVDGTLDSQLTRGDGCWRASEGSTYRIATTPGIKYWIQVGGYDWWDYGTITTQVN